MKKAIVLGVMALFAINFITIQNATAQDRGATQTNKSTVESKKTTVKTDPSKTAKTDVNVNDSKTAKSSIKTSINEGNKAAKAGQTDVQGKTDQKAVKKAEQSSLKVAKPTTKPTAAQNDEAIKTNLKTSKEAEKASLKTPKPTTKPATATTQEAGQTHKMEGNKTGIKKAPKLGTDKKNNLKMKPKEIKTEKTNTKAAASTSATTK